MYLSSSIQAQSVILKLIQITLLLVIIGMVISPAFAQQFREPDYTIAGAKVLDFILDPEDKTLTISLDVRSRGEITITLLRNIIDARSEGGDREFTIKINNLEYLFFEEIKTPTDRTITIPFGKSESEIVIFGTHVFSQGTTEPTEQSQDLIEQKIASELRSEIPDGKAKLLIFSDTDWSGAFQASGLDYTETEGSNDKSIIFACDSSPFRQGVFAAKFHKNTDEGYLRLVAIQNNKIIDQRSITAQSGEVTINGNCVSSFGPGSEGGGCLIATATFGSELAPQVQQLREIRDNILQTDSGSAFMNSFNQIYYTFSPTIADLERENPVFKEVVKLTITPLISRLLILNYVDMDSEASVVGYGISLIMLNVGMYVLLPTFAILQLRRML